MLGPTPNRQLLEQAVAAIKAGDKALGEHLLMQVLQAEPRNVLALLWLTKCTADPHRIAELYQQALSIEPGNPHAQKGTKLYRNYARKVPRSTQSPPSPQRDLSPSQLGPSISAARAPSNRNLLTALGICAILLLGGVAAFLAFARPSAEPPPDIVGPQPERTSATPCGQDAVSGYVTRLVSRQNELNADLDAVLANAVPDPSYFAPYALKAQRRYHAQAADPSAGCIPALQATFLDALDYNRRALEAAAAGEWDRSASLMRMMDDELSTIAAALSAAQDLSP